MKTHKNLYTQICSLGNLELAFKKAKRGKFDKYYVKEFKENLEIELNRLRNELETFGYKPKKLKRFIIQDPKSRTIYASAFRDRVVHHALINIIEPIFEKIFICDSYASRKNKGTLKAIERFERFKRKVSKNNQCVNKAYNKNMIKGYVLKADIKHYFNTINHDILIKLIKKKINDENIIGLIGKILNNYENPKIFKRSNQRFEHFNMKIKGRGVPLGNLTSQFFASVYLNELDYFVKHKLKAKYYIRYVDDFVILDSNKELLKYYQSKIDNFLKEQLDLELHPDKSKIIALKNGINFLGFRIFGFYKLLRKRNLRHFKIKFEDRLELFKEGLLEYEDFIKCLEGWFGYAMWGDTYRLRKGIVKRINLFSRHPIGDWPPTS